MNSLFIKARQLLASWKGERYLFGMGALPKTGVFMAGLGKRALLVCNAGYLKDALEKVTGYLTAAGVSLAGGAPVSGAAPNAPQEDVYRLADQIRRCQPDCVIAMGGGSTIDSCKAANILAALGGETGAGNASGLESCFGTGLVTAALNRAGKRLLPLAAIQTAASSAAHLTKYANVTNPAAGQKKLIADEGIIPPRALFDYTLSVSVPAGVTIDGAQDGIAHCFEVLMGMPEETYPLAASLAETAITLIVEYAPRAAANGGDLEAREALGLATDLGGYAIMIGGTGGAHLTSFSLTDLTSHGKACGIMNPYYAVFFAPRIERQLRLIGNIFKNFGYIQENLENLGGQELGRAAAGGMIAFGKAIGAPVTLDSLPGFSAGHISRALEAAKNPQLAMKLKNMPIPLTANMADEYMGPILQAAAAGDFSLIKPL
jgi:alcohol dehydrogenase class IV